MPLVQVGERSQREVAEEFESAVAAVRRWVTKAEREHGPRQDGLRHTKREELVRLRRENKWLKQEWQILSKAAA